MSYLSKIIRLKECYLNNIWEKYKGEKEFFSYFPNKFKKYPPPKAYFWKVFSVLKREEYDKILNKTKLRLVKHKRIKEVDLKLTEEAIEILNNFKDEDLNLLSKIKSAKKL